ncbi:MAG: OmpA family protein [Flavobacterium sp.]
MKKATILCLNVFLIGNIATSCKSSKPATVAPEPVVVAPAPVETLAPATPAPEVIDVAGINARVNEMLNKNAITFEIDKDVLSQESQAKIDATIPVVSQFPNVQVTINGYCDESGSVELNNELSRRRAESVKKYLVSKGLKAENFQTVGLGFSNPVAPNTTPENRAKNRRAVFSVSLTEEVIREVKTKGFL